VSFFEAVGEFSASCSIGFSCSGLQVDQISMGLSIISIDESGYYSIELADSIDESKF